MSWNPHIVRAFELFFRPWMSRRLAAIHVRGSVDAIPDDRPVIVVANHASWWDAFLVRELHRRCGGASPIFTLMKEDELARYPLFRRMGVLGLSPRPASVRGVLRELGARSGPFWVTLFAQGRIWPSWKRPLGFEGGVELFAKALAPCAVVPVAIHLEAMAQSAPTAFIGVGEAISVAAGESTSAQLVEDRVEELLDTLFTILAIHGEKAAAVWQQEVPLSSSHNDSGAIFHA